jgi:predicted dehydrogenase
MSTLHLSRRRLLKCLPAIGVPLWIPRSVLGGAGQVSANERIGVGAIGVGHRASLLLEQLPESARIVALCDCNLPRAEEFRKKKNGTWPVLQDYRRLLERRDIDAVIVGTREHQRVLPSIHACQAGKDVYAEKPLSLYIHEGRVLVQAVRKYKRILQVGSQQRSMQMNRIACEFIRSGGLGKLLEVQAINYPGPGALPDKPLPAQPVPAGLNWDLWLNQAAWRPYNKGVGGSLDMAGGEMTNWGAHGLDQVQWALGMDGTGPVEMWPMAPGLKGEVGMRYTNGLEVKFIIGKKGPWGGAIFIGENGKLEINRNKFNSNPKEIADELHKKVDVAEEERKWSDKMALWQARWHLQNWLDCIRSRQLPVADVEIGHRSISVCHLANITRYVGRKLRWDPAAERFFDAEADQWVVRTRRKGYELPDLG